MYGTEAEGYKRCKVMQYITLQKIQETHSYLSMRKAFIFITCNINISQQLCIQ